MTAVGVYPERALGSEACGFAVGERYVGEANFDEFWHNFGGRNPSPKRAWYKGVDKIERKIGLNYKGVYEIERKFG